MGVHSRKGNNAAGGSEGLFLAIPTSLGGLDETLWPVSPFAVRFDSPDRRVVRGGDPRSIAAVREDARFRTNLILANAYPTSLVVNVALLDGNGLQLATKSYTLQGIGALPRLAGGKVPVMPSRMLRPCFRRSRLQN